MCVCVCKYTQTKTIWKKVTSKFQTTLPHIHTQKIPKTHTDAHIHTEEKMLMKSKTIPTHTYTPTHKEKVG